MLFVSEDYKQSDMDDSRDEESTFSDVYLDESFASVGDSTRSLLSPILNEKLCIRSSTPGKDRPNTESDDEEGSYHPEKSKHMVLTSISLAKRRGHLSTTERSDSSFGSSFTDSSKCKEMEKDSQLSPWEKWLVRKTLENREKMKDRRMEETKMKKELIEKEKEEKERQKQIEEKIGDWIEDKEVKERIKREEKKKVTEEQRRSKIEKQNGIEEKSKIVYRKWLEEKKSADLETKKKKEEKEWEEKEREVEKRMKNEQAFEEWLRKSKSHSKSDNQNDCSYVVAMQGCYDWASYPSPSYINPMPWVNPVSKRNRERQRRKKALQPVSPPLLFRDYEDRKKKGSSKNVMK